MDRHFAWRQRNQALSPRRLLEASYKMMPANRRLSQDDRFSSIAKLKAAEYFAVPAISTCTNISPAHATRGWPANNSLWSQPAVPRSGPQHERNALFCRLDRSHRKTSTGMPSTHAKRIQLINRAFDLLGS